MDKWERREQKRQKGKTKIKRRSNLKNLKVGIDARTRRDLEGKGW